MKTKILYLVLFVVFLYSCHWIYGYRYNEIIFEKTVQNLGEINSSYDDYNMSAPWIKQNHLLLFSSNRNTQGKNFDIIGFDMLMDFDRRNGTLTISHQDIDSLEFNPITKLIETINTNQNELGPYLISLDDQYLMMFANDNSGSFDIHYILLKKQINHQKDESEPQIRDLDFLNSSANDLYPTFFGENFNYDHPYSSFTIEKILFCSDRNGNFDLFEADIKKDSTLMNVLKPKINPTIKKLEINSTKEDKCPFVSRDLLVFASNREGGYGGYDLYYSKYKNGKWSQPKNFGDKINTPYDEYRPIVSTNSSYKNKLLLFSSNRPGGKGGFDLYYMGISK